MLPIALLMLLPQSSTSHLKQLLPSTIAHTLSISTMCKQVRTLHYGCDPEHSTTKDHICKGAMEWMLGFTPTDVCDGWTYRKSWVMSCCPACTADEEAAVEAAVEALMSLNTPKQRRRTMSLEAKGVARYIHGAWVYERNIIPTEPMNEKWPRKSPKETGVGKVWVLKGHA